MEELNKREKSWIVTILLCLFLGIFGIHRFYVGKVKSAILQLITLGGVGIWSFIDLIIIAKQKFQDKNRNEVKENKKKNLNIVIVVLIIVAIINVLVLVSGINNMDELDEDLNHYEELFNSIDTNMQVFINRNASAAEEKRIEMELNKINGIATIEYISKEMACQEMQEKLGESVNLNKDSFPASYKITILDLSRANEIYNKILLLDNVSKVNNGYKSLKQVDTATNIVSSYKIIAIFSVIIRVIEVLVIILTIFIINRNKKTLSV